MDLDDQLKWPKHITGLIWWGDLHIFTNCHSCVFCYYPGTCICTCKLKYVCVHVRVSLWLCVCLGSSNLGENIRRLCFAKLESRFLMATSQTRSHSRCTPRVPEVGFRFCRELSGHGSTVYNMSGNQVFNHKSQLWALLPLKHRKGMEWDYQDYRLKRTRMY